MALKQECDRCGALGDAKVISQQITSLLTQSYTYTIEAKGFETINMDGALRDLCDDCVKAVRDMFELAIPTKKGKGDGERSGKQSKAPSR